MNRLLFLLLFHIIAFNTNGQTFLNGSFEINSVSNCMVNTIDNSAFNAVMTNIRGIGNAQTLDIFFDQDCPTYGLAQSGNYFVSVENNTADPTQSTAISLKLANTLQTGVNYNFCYFDKGLGTGFGFGPIEIGVSNTDSTFGTVIYTSPSINTTWTLRTVNFISPITANYITVRYGAFNGGALVDNFGMCVSTGVNSDLTSENNYRVFPNPTTSDLNIELPQNDSNLRLIRILSPLGQELFKSIKADKINIASFANGFYILEITTDKKIFCTKFLKQ